MAEQIEQDVEVSTPNTRVKVFNSLTEMANFCIVFNITSGQWQAQRMHDGCIKYVVQYIDSEYR